MYLSYLTLKWYYKRKLVQSINEEENLLSIPNGPLISSSMTQQGSLNQIQNEVYRNSR